jgi:hypothetical protein
MESFKPTIDLETMVQNYLKRFPSATEKDVEDLVFLIRLFGQHQRSPNAVAKPIPPTGRVLRDMDITPGIEG